VGPELTIRDNRIKNIGNYAVDSSAAAVLQNNLCTAPFQVAGLPSNAFDQGGFRFTGAGSSGVIAHGNVIDSISVSSVVIHGSVTASIISWNCFASIYDTYLFNGSGIFKSWSERIINPVGSTLITTPVYSLSISGDTAIPPTATENTGNSMGKEELVLSGTRSTITGTALITTSYDSGTAKVTGAAVGHPVAVSSTTGAHAGGAHILRGSVTAINTVTVFICGTGTPQVWLTTSPSSKGAVNVDGEVSDDGSDAFETLKHRCGVWTGAGDEEAFAPLGRASRYGPVQGKGQNEGR
jgi:hypothetical protein